MSNIGEEIDLGIIDFFFLFVFKSFLLVFVSFIDSFDVVADDPVDSATDNDNV